MTDTRNTPEGTLAGYKALARAIIKQAEKDIRWEPSAEELEEYVRMVRAEAREWFLSDSFEQGSFLRCCETGSVDPVRVRKRLGYAS